MIYCTTTVYTAIYWHYYSLHSYLLGLLQLTLPYKLWLELLGLVHQILKMMIFNIMQQIILQSSGIMSLPVPIYAIYGTRGWVITNTCCMCIIAIVSFILQRQSFSLKNLNIYHYYCFFEAMWPEKLQCLALISLFLHNVSEQ